MRKAISRTAQAKIAKLKFDRKTWDVKNDLHYFILNRLRVRGFSRACSLRRAEESDFSEFPVPNKFYALRSTAFEEAQLLVKRGVFVDAGAGLSPDTSIARLTGFGTVYGFDLFPGESYRSRELGVRSVKADIVEKIPLPARTVDLMVCQAVLPLMNATDRLAFYQQARRVLKIGVYLSVYFCELNNEHPWNLATERARCLDQGFGLYKNFGQGFVVQRLK